MPEDRVVFSPAQVAALVSCRALTDLDAGEWIPSVDDSADDVAAEEPGDDSNDDDMNAGESDNDGEGEEVKAGEKASPPLSDRLQKAMDAGLVALIQGRKRNGAAPLRNIRLGFSDDEGCITPAVAAHLLAMHELERLERVVWNSSLTAEHWAQLSLFTRLHTIHIGAVPAEVNDAGRVSLQLDAPLLALQHCSLLSSISLAGVGKHASLLLSAELTVLLASLPRLQSLSLRCVCVESLDPLSSAPALSHLSLNACSAPGIQSCCMRSLVPRLPRLTSLTIKNEPTFPRDSKCPAEDKRKSAAITAALLKRLPLLRASALHLTGLPPRTWTGSIYGPPRSAPEVRI